ncbi:fumarate hydratase [Methanocella sp. CWC-04]|uniref:Fumarate hydratase n=1 Tax=Methanooceanicella nereidis TaxID=2052831 RepID=A0AAP2W8H3_9EURY|nr:FumA C-terminus/TtdB family hydratase beta subunit [Methanocella sp. CWC-04]MCD1296204.1 fumarate hydratase [Methanocella sp. CWC-04]
MEYHLSTPVSREDIKKLKAGDVVYISGTFLTARDKAHMRILEYFSSGKQLPFDLEGSVIFHGAPVVEKEGEEWKIVAIGPTTSARMNDLEPDVIRNGGILIVGKGGMDKSTLKALHDSCSAYLSMTGGIAVIGARMVENVAGVEWLDLGLAEAVWKLEVKDFGPLTVTMDAHMNDLYENVRQRVSENIKKMG